MEFRGKSRKIKYFNLGKPKLKLFLLKRKKATSPFSDVLFASYKQICHQNFKNKLEFIFKYYRSTYLVLKQKIKKYFLFLERKTQNLFLSARRETGIIAFVNRKKNVAIALQKVFKNQSITRKKLAKYIFLFKLEALRRKISKAKALLKTSSIKNKDSTSLKNTRRTTHFSKTKHEWSMGLKRHFSSKRKTINKLEMPIDEDKFINLRLKSIPFNKKLVLLVREEQNRILWKKIYKRHQHLLDQNAFNFFLFEKAAFEQEQSKKKRKSSKFSNNLLYSSEKESRKKELQGNDFKKLLSLDLLFLKDKQLFDIEYPFEDALDVDPKDEKPFIVSLKVLKVVKTKLTKEEALFLNNIVKKTLKKAHEKRSLSSKT